jgi:hypothetical protein
VQTTRQDPTYLVSQPYWRSRRRICTGVLACPSTRDCSTTLSVGSWQPQPRNQTARKFGPTGAIWDRIHRTARHEETPVSRDTRHTAGDRHAACDGRVVPKAD